MRTTFHMPVTMVLYLPQTNTKLKKIFKGRHVVTLY